MIAKILNATKKKVKKKNLTSNLTKLDSDKNNILY